MKRTKLAWMSNFVLFQLPDLPAGWVAWGGSLRFAKMQHCRKTPFDFEVWAINYHDQRLNQEFQALPEPGS